MTSYHFNSAIFYHNLKYQAVVDLKDFNLDCLKRGVEVRKIGQGQIIKSLELRPQYSSGRQTTSESLTLEHILWHCFHVKFRNDYPIL